ncbi:polysialoglycoprotein-like [Epinephelus moara]|uniref:polysialoglycoprotein-like n=1 Tax=Epinephelus moara TaxID=300413 RepID=UPI00214EC58D|nr:polysialoglycoprotein-like [Epinephelus moara]
MGAVWALLFCLLTVWLVKGSCLPVGGTNEGLDALQRRIRDVSPNDISIKKALALLQSMETMLEHNAKEVQLETNEVEAEASVGHLKLVQQTGPKELKTQKDDYDSHMASGSVTPPASYHHNNVTVANGLRSNNVTAASDQESGNVTAASDQESGNVTAASDQESGNVTAASDQESGNVTAASDQESGNVTAASDQESGNVTAANDNGAVDEVTEMGPDHGNSSNVTEASDDGAVNEAAEMGPESGAAVTKMSRVGAKTPKLITNSHGHGEPKLK